MKVIGIDVGIRNTGYAVIDDSPRSGLKLLSCGVEKTGAGEPISVRLRCLYLKMKELIAKESPDVAVYETIFYKHNPRALVSLAQARGVLMLVAEELGVKVKEYSPAEIKRAITGSGRASKYQVHGMVERLLGVKIPAPSDIGDAVSCALCYALRDERSHRLHR